MGLVLFILHWSSSHILALKRGLVCRTITTMRLPSMFISSSFLMGRAISTALNWFASILQFSSLSSGNALREMTRLNGNELLVLVLIPPSPPP